MRINTKLNDVDKQSDRLKKYITYFSKEVKADKVIMILICCICIFVIVIIVGFILPDKSGDSRTIFERLQDDTGITSIL